MQRGSELVQKRLHIYEFLAAFFALGCGVLIFSVMVLTNVFSFSFTTSLATYTKKGNAFGKFYEFADQKYVGEIRVIPHEFTGTFIQGELRGLSPGHSYSILILENSNFLIDDLKDEKFYHLNPTKAETHSCNKVLSENKGHKGDLGNIIAASNGIANVEVLVKNLNYIELLGRSIVVLNHEDNCENHSPYILRNEIMAYSIIALYSDNSDLEDFEKTINKKKLEQAAKQKPKIEMRKELKNDNPVKSSAFKTPIEHIEPDIPEIQRSSELPEHPHYRNLEPLPQTEIPEHSYSENKEINHEHSDLKEQEVVHTPQIPSKTPEYIQPEGIVNEVPEHQQPDTKKETHGISSPPAQPVQPVQPTEHIEPYEPMEHIDDEDNYFDSMHSNNDIFHNNKGSTNMKPTKKHIDQDDQSQNFMDSIFGPLMKQAHVEESMESSQNKKKENLKKKEPEKPNVSPPQESKPKLFHGTEANSLFGKNGVDPLEGLKEDFPFPFASSDDDNYPEDNMQPPEIIKKSNKANEMNFKELMFDAHKREEVKKNLTNIITTKFDLPFHPNITNGVHDAIEIKSDPEVKKLSKNFENNVKEDLKKHLKELEPSQKIAIVKPNFLPIDPILLLEHSNHL